MLTSNVLHIKPIQVLLVFKTTEQYTVRLGLWGKSESINPYIQNLKYGFMSLCPVELWVMVIDLFIPENAFSLFNLLPLSTVCSTYQRLSSCFEIFLANFKLGIQQPHFAKGKLQKKTKTLFTKGRNVYTNIVSYRRRRNHCNLETFILTILVNKNCIVTYNLGQHS